MEGSGGEREGGGRGEWPGGSTLQVGRRDAPERVTRREEGDGPAGAVRPPQVAAAFVPPATQAVLAAHRAETAKTEAETGAAAACKLEAQKQAKPEEAERQPAGTEAPAPGGGAEAAAATGGEADPAAPPGEEAAAPFAVGDMVITKAAKNKAAYDGRRGKVVKAPRADRGCSRGGERGRQRPVSGDVGSRWGVLICRWTQGRMGWRAGEAPGGCTAQLCSRNRPRCSAARFAWSSWMARSKETRRTSPSSVSPRRSPRRRRPQSTSPALTPRRCDPGRMVAGRFGRWPESAGEPRWVGGSGGWKLRSGWGLVVDARRTVTPGEREG